MRNVLWIAANILKKNFRKKSSIISFIVLPVIFVVVSMVINANWGNSSNNMTILDNDKSQLSMNYVKSLEKQKAFNVVKIDESNINKSIISGDLEYAVIVPKGFQKSFYDNNMKKLEIKSLKGDSTTVWINNYTNIYLKNLKDMWKSSGENKNLFNKIYRESQFGKISLNIKSVKDTTEGKQVTSQSIGFLIMFLMVNAGILSQFILDEKKNRTYFRICSAPVSSKNYILGNVFSNILIVISQIIITLLALTRIFKVNTYVPFWQLFVILSCFGVAAVALGLVFTSFSKSSSEVGTFVTLVSTPTCMISGCFLPVDLMPKSMQKIADFLPQRWTISAIEKLQQNLGFSSIYINLVVILAFALTFFIIAAYRFSIDENIKNFI